MLLKPNTVIKEYKVVEFLHTNRRAYREEYVGINNENKTVLIVTYDTTSQKLSKNAYIKEIGFQSCVFSPSFMELCDDFVTVIRKKRIQVLVYKYQKTITLEEAMYLGKIKQDDALRIFFDIAIGVKELKYCCHDAIHTNLSPKTVMVYWDKRKKARGIITNLQYVYNYCIKKNTIDYDELNPCYTPPEYDTGCMSERSMEFSIALLLAFMLQGYHPWLMPIDSTDSNHRKQFTMAKPVFNVPAKLIDCLYKALQPIPQHRYETIEEFVSEAMKSSPFKMPVTYECFGKGCAPKKKKRNADIKS